MADPTLLGALSGLQFRGIDSPYGIGAQALAQATPGLINPYGSVGSNLGITLGSTLIQALLGYQARQDAAQQSVEALRYGNQLMAAQTPEERLGIIESVPSDGWFGPDMRGRLTGLTAQLNNQGLLANALAAQQTAKLEADADFQLGDKGTELFNRELEREKVRNDMMLDRLLAVQAARDGGKSGGEEKKDWWSSVPAGQKSKFTTVAGQTAELRSLAEEYRKLGSNALALRAQELIPGTAAELAKARLEALVPTTARMLGEVGNLAQQEQERLIDSTLGGKLSGSEAIATRIERLAATAERIVKEQAKAYDAVNEGGGRAILDMLEGRGGKDTITTVEPDKATGNEEAIKRNRELKERLARLEAMMGQK